MKKIFVDVTVMWKLLYLLLHAVIINTADLNFEKHCSKCPPGWGVKKLCTKYSATECERCVIGDTYSSYNSYNRWCWPCSKCGIGLYESRKCSPRRDTVCDDCTRYIFKPEIKTNMDFQEKCSYLFLGRG